MKISNEKKSVSHKPVGGDTRKKILIAVMPVPDGFVQYGSLPPLIKAGEIANKRGYEVIWTCCECLRDIISRSFPGNEVVTYSDTTVFGLPPIFRKMFVKLLDMDLPQWLMPGLKKNQNSEWLFESYVTIGLHKQKYLDTGVLSIINTILGKEVDVMMSFADPLGMIAAHITGIPFINYTNLMPVKESGGKKTKKFNAAVSKTIGQYSPDKKDVVKFSEIYHNDRQLTLLSSIEHIGEKPKKKNATYVADFKINKKSIRKDASSVTTNDLQNQRVVFAYFGTMSVSFNYARKVLSKAFELVNKNNSGKPWHCYYASQHIKKAYSEGNVHFAPYYDGEFLMNHAELTFAHGGLMTVYDSLRLGVPLILIPGSLYERRFNSQEVVATGSGIMVEVDDFTPQNIANHIQNEAELKRMRDNANRMAGKITESGNLEDAFIMVETSWLNSPDKEKRETVGSFLHQKELIR